MPANEPSEALSDNEARIYRSISGALLDGKLRPGTPLRERVLADTFNATRTAVRKVLVVLEREGKVELRQNRGAFVPQPTLDDIHTLYDARRAVETGILMLLSGRLNKVQLHELEQHVRHEEEAHRTGDREKSVRLAGAFHTRLTKILGNNELAAFLQRLVARTQIFVALYESHDESGCAPAEHREIVDALAQGKTTVAVDAMVSHLDEIEARVARRVALQDQEDLKAIFDRY
ncbi:bacterial regulatory s, gntR family protein [Paraburkholderia xenovorans LB400]|uniref:Transcriptional regulator, GntR family n=1 Tax=Paraburkholderia xenovorans (strain LB400) TaxID=266265 RepID=Q13GZ0_PARXL|nr:GntR family transcriptional regulator [Paraburkholderia xenovorans]ABE36649.1 transcriptional regulator, GntR family [Paraburkholderia xenovorans LB400]AIP34953.1 bacterial regulatory s, gntR family protein [Paraburkholderia xenovorans LB400]